MSLQKNPPQWLRKMPLLTLYRSLALICTHAHSYSKDPASTGPTLNENGEEILIARYDYEVRAHKRIHARYLLTQATDEGEISFVEGEQLVLLEKDESGWWKYVFYLSSCREHLSYENLNSF